MSEPTPLSPLKQAYLALERMQEKLNAIEQVQREPIAVIGLGCRFPGKADSPEAFWQLLCNGFDAITEVPSDRWNIDEYYHPDPDVSGKIATRWGGFLDQIDQFDPQLFDIAPREAISMDPQQRLLLEVSWEALEHAGYAPDRLAGSRTGVFVGIVGNDYAQLQLADNGITQIDTYFGSGIGHSIASGRISYVLGLQGPSISIDTACSSSLVAIHLAVQSLRTGECQMAMAGGVNAILAPDMSIALSRFHMMAADGRCKTFDASADGFVRGEGCGMVILKRLSDAVADGDRVLAVIRGSAINQDGASSGLTAPNGPSQEALIRAALANASVKPAQVSYVEAHGTGTSLGDPIELQALGAVLREGRSADQPVAIGSVKTNLGHLEAAAGVAGLIKAVLCLQHREIPRHLHFQQPNPLIAWESLPVWVPTEHTLWTAPELIAGVSSFGFSGTNAHIILAEAPPLPAVEADQERSHHLLTLSAHTPEALKAQGQRLEAHLTIYPDVSLADVCFTANAGRADLRYRLALSASSLEQVRDGLRALTEGQDSGAIATGYAQPESPKIAFLFTGQGAQFIGMGRQLYETQPTFRAALQQCDALLKPHLDQSLLSVLYSDSNTSLLDQTAYTQPALFAISYALCQLWKSWGIEPTAVMGHSVGEYAAACATGVFSLEDGLKLIAARGRLMQALPAEGEMVAIFADKASVVATIPPNVNNVEIAAVNSPQNTVISGAAAAVQALVKTLEAKGIKTHPLTVSHAFHSPLIEPILDEFEQTAASIAYHAPQIRFVSTLTGEVTGADCLQAKYWRTQTRETVRFADAVQTLYAQGYRVFLEMGPHPTLCRLAQQCLPDCEMLALPSLCRGEEDWQTLLKSLGTLYVQGVQVDWAGFDRDYPRHRLALPTYPFQRQRYWLQRQPQARLTVPLAGSHPLLGQRLPSPLQSLQYEGQIRCEHLSFLNDHRVQGRAILPATGFLELGLAAATALSDSLSSHQILDFVIHEALAVADHDICTVQTIVTPDNPQHATLQIFSACDSSSNPAQKWKLHATGILQAVTAKAVPSSETIRAIQARCQTEVAGLEHYQQLGDRNLAFGSSLQGVQRIWRREGEAIGQIQAPPSIQSELGVYQVHPAVLDACLQVLATAMPTIMESDLYLPIAVDRFQVYAQFPTQLWSHVQIQSLSDRPSPETLSCTIQVLDEQGIVLAELSGLRLKRTSQVTLPSITQDGSQWLYQVEWQLQPHPLTDTAELSSPDAIAHQIQPLVPQISTQYRLQEYRELSVQLNQLSTGYILYALQQLGWQPELDLPVTVCSLATALGIVDKYHRLLERLLEILQNDRWMQFSHSAWNLLRIPPVLTREALQNRWQTLLTQFPDFDAELTLLGRCGSELAAVLAGNADPLSLLFPENDLSTAAKLYQKSPVAQAYNRLVQEAITAALAKLPIDRSLRVLEIGAGTGGTTAYVLPKLPGDRTCYTFTDISPVFTAKAAEKFQDYSFVQYQPLDIEQDPITQGFPAQEFDLILAANVIHATADLQQTLQHVQQLLAPGGLLLLLEMTLPEPWIDLTFGLTDGWWRFIDTDIRPTYPLLTQSEWLTVLTTTGFTDATAIPESSNSEMPSEAVFLARASQPLQAPENWLIFADQGGIGIRLAEQLKIRGANSLLVFPGEDYEEQGERVYIDPANSQQLHQLFENTASTQWHGVVHLWSLDVLALDESDATTWQSTQTLGCGSVLSLVQSLVSLAASPRLWLVTRHAQPVGNLHPLSVLQSPVWGLGQTIALEHPELRCTRIDLDEIQSAAASQLLFHEITLPTAEDQIGFRNQQRYVARLARSLPSSTIDHPLPEPEPVRLEIPARGLLDHLTFCPLVRRCPKPDEVEIRVRATGLNFRDVLNALDLYPGDPGLLGSECAGEIVAVGEAVKDLRVGDAVVVIAPGCFSTFVTTSSDFVVRKPRPLSFEEAAALPIPFLTAYFTLHHLGGIAQGNRVLIHAAAGGVGLAAVQIAQQVGAEVFATAGTPEKRAYLQSLGVAHVMSSRSLDFADQIMTITQGQGVNLVLNSLADEFASRSLSVLATGGRFLEIGKRGILTPDDVATLRPDAAYFVVDWGETSKTNPPLIRRLFLELIEMLDQKILQPLPTQVFPLQDAVSAFRYMAAAKHTGKIVVSHPTSPPIAASAIADDLTYLITGGLGGLGIRVAEWLVAQGAKYLVLVGRRPPTEAAQRAIANLQQAGVHLVVAQADVSNHAQIAQVLTEIELSLPPLRGVIHAAGVLDDGVLLHQTWGRFTHVMAAKVAGAWHLHDLTRSLPLDFFVLFSSIASLLGSAGQGNHAAANAFMDTLAHYRRSQGLPALSINWGVWSEVGAAVDRNVVEYAAEQGIGIIPPDQGVQLLQILLQQSSAQVGVAPIDWAMFLRQTHRQPAFFANLLNSFPVQSQEVTLPTTHASFWQQLLTASHNQQPQLVAGYIEAQVRKVLGIGRSLVIHDRIPFSELGLDSLMAIELKNLLGKELQLKQALPATLVFDYPTIHDLTQYLLRYVQAELSPEPDSQFDRPSLDQGNRQIDLKPNNLLDQLEVLEELSDAEVDRLLANYQSSN